MKTLLNFVFYFFFISFADGSIKVSKNSSSLFTNSSECLRRHGFQRTCSKLPKYSNQNYQYLRVLTFNYEPFMYKNDVGHFYKGIDFEFLKLLSQKLDRKLLLQEWIDEYQIQQFFV